MIFQVEYAIEAIKLGSTAIGIRTDEGCVLACEKRLTSSLMEPTTIEKIVEVDKHLATAYSGLAAGTVIVLRIQQPAFRFLAFFTDFCSIKECLNQPFFNHLEAMNVTRTLSTLTRLFFHRFFGNTNKWICRILEFRKKFLSLGRKFLSLEGKFLSLERKIRGFIVKNCIFLPHIFPKLQDFRVQL